MKTSVRIERIYLSPSLIVARLSKVSTKAKTDKYGKWLLYFWKVKEGGPYALKISESGKPDFRIKLTGILSESMAELKEVQTLTLLQPNTDMACIIDFGNENSIHPTNKQEVGRRLVLIVKKSLWEKCYCLENNVKNFVIKSKDIIISFTGIGN